ncbi:MAG: dihydrodipicolinate synthase family protein [Vicinamibacterales bacterium]|jgi:4-hydroxy-tetrahydrodipicolinate synthase|nr:dihydrodipicolinate synthase family protein [Vicinamibacterales bacterium]
MTSLAGIIPIVPTTFHDDGRLDLESQRRVVRVMIDSGAHALGLFGNASEGYTLTEDERRQLLKVIVEENAGAVPLVVSSGHTGTDAAVALSREAEAAGASALMVLPPYYMKPDAAGVFHYFAAISRAVRIPIMVQDAPLMTQLPMGVDLLARMARELEQVRMVKVEAPPTAQKVSKLRELAGDGLTLLGGLNGHFLLEELARGSVGTMPGGDMTDVFRQIWDAWQRGDRAGARARFEQALPLIRYELQPGMGVGVMKRNLYDAGVIASPAVRHPSRTLDELDVAEVRELRAPLDLFAFRWAGSRR